MNIEELISLLNKLINKVFRNSEELVVRALLYDLIALTAFHYAHSVFKFRSITNAELEKENLAWHFTYNFLFRIDKNNNRIILFQRNNRKLLRAVVELDD